MSVSVSEIPKSAKFSHRLILFDPLLLIKCVIMNSSKNNYITDPNARLRTPDDLCAVDPQ